MSEAPEVNLSERDLKLGVLKLAAVLVLGLALIALLISLAFEDAQTITLPMLFVSFAFVMLTNGALALTKLIDWLEARKARRNG